MKKSERISLLMIAILAGLFISFAIMTVSASWGCYGYGCDCDGCNHFAKAQVEQHLWDMDAYRFLYCDECYPSFVSMYQTYQYPVQTSSQILENGTAQYWQTKGDELYLAGSYELAATSYSKAVELDPYLAKGWLNLGNSLYFLGKYQEALNSYNAALALNPQNENALQGKTQSLLALNRTIEANAAQKTLNALQSRNILKIGSTHNTVVVGDH
jgi:tetratricopeptide (TPR) repeat protein